MVKVSAATVPEKVTSSGAALASESLTVMVLPVPVSVMVPAMLMVDAFRTVNVELPLKAMFEAMVTVSLTVAVFEAAMVRLSAVTAALKVALLFKVTSAKVVLPTIPLKVAAPEPKVSVRSRLVRAASLSTVELKVTLLLVVVNVTSVLKVTAPAYVCVDDVVTLAPRLEVPETLKVDKPVAAPSRSRLPVTVKALVPPAKVDTKFTVEPVSVLSPPERVTAPV